MKKQPWDLRHRLGRHGRERWAVTQTSASRGLPRPSVAGQNAGHVHLPGVTPGARALGVQRGQKALHTWVHVPSRGGGRGVFGIRTVFSMRALGSRAAVASCTEKKHQASLLWSSLVTTSFPLAFRLG